MWHAEWGYLDTLCMKVVDKLLDAGNTPWHGPIECTTVQR